MVNLFRTSPPDQEKRKSNVRIVVTYGVVFMYILMACVFTGVLIALGELEKALVIFGSVSTMAVGITGFWFGSRGAGYSQTEKERDATGPKEPPTKEEKKGSVSSGEKETNRKKPDYPISV